MPSLKLESPTDSFDLDSVLKTDAGVQVLSGVTGLGLPPVAGQWMEGAGDGATYRRTRVLPRDIDLPVLIQGYEREGMKALASRLAFMLASPCTLVFREDDGEEWSTEVVRVGGGSYVYGADTEGGKDLFLVITVRAGDPFWTSSKRDRKVIGEVSTVPQGLLMGSLTGLGVASSQAMGQIELDNTGNATAYPVWEVIGPGNNVELSSVTGETMRWLGTLTIGERLIFDTKKGTVVDGTGANRYALLDSAPRFWSIPPGKTTANALMLGVDPATSRIICTWQPRQWMVV